MKEKRINRIIKNIPNQFFDGKKEDAVSNVRTMKVGVELQPEMEERLDILMNDADLKRREVLESLMTEFYNNPENLIEKSGKITQKTDKKTGEVVENHKFSSKKLYGILYTNYAKGNSYKNYASALFYEDVLINVAKEVCSFLDKYYTIQAEINKTIKENNKIKEKITIKITNLPEKVASKKESEEYNKLVAQNNILINLYNQKQETNDTRLKFFKNLKGFPSFSLIEKRKELNYDELNKIFEPHLKNAKLFWSAINDNQMKIAMEHFYNRIVYKWFEYYYKLEAIEPKKDNEYKDSLIKWSSADIDIIIERIDKKIEKIKTNTDQDKKQKTEWLRGKSLIIFEYLRQSNQKEFAKVRADFDLQSSINAGFISKNIEYKKVFEITGFSKGKKSTILVENSDEITTTGLIKNNYSLAFNVSKLNPGFKLDNKSNFEGYVSVPIYKTDENNNIIYKRDEEGNFEVTKNGNKIPEKLGDYTELKKISFDKEGTFILPLKFGKRYAREYLYNDELNFENKGITLNNARIIKEGKKYFVAITFTKLKGNKP